MYGRHFFIYYFYYYYFFFNQRLMLKILDLIFLPISYQQYAISQNFLHGDCYIYTIICYFTLLFICLNLKFVLSLRV